MSLRATLPFTYVNGPHMTDKSSRLCSLAIQLVGILTTSYLSSPVPEQSQAAIAIVDITTAS